MADPITLVSETPLSRLLPLQIGALRLEAAPPQSMTAIAPYAAQQAQLTEALFHTHTLDWPAPGRSTGGDGARLMWFGRDLALLMGPVPDARLADHAALWDQSDSWASLILSGPGAEDALARLVPVDLRAAHFPPGACARTLIGHMNGAVCCLGRDRFLLMVYRSMAGTLHHDMQRAMESVAERG